MEGLTAKHKREHLVVLWKEDSEKRIKKGPEKNRELSQPETGSRGNIVYNACHLADSLEPGEV